MVREEDQPKKKGWFSRKKNSPLPPTPGKHVQRPPSTSTFSPGHRRAVSSSSTMVANPEKEDDEEDLPPRIEAEGDMKSGPNDSTPSLPLRAGFDLSAMKEIIGTVADPSRELHTPPPADSRISRISPPPVASSSQLPKDKLPPIPDQYSSMASSIDRGLPSLPPPSPNPSIPMPVQASSIDDDEELSWQTDPITLPRADDLHSEHASYEREGSQVSPFPPFDIESTRDPFASSAGLSIGGFDSGINSAHVDPWAMPPLPEKSPGYANPWGN